MDGLQYLGSQLDGDDDPVLVAYHVLSHMQIFLVSVIVSYLLVKIIASQR